jgi:Cu+-exporting ATPase
MTRPFQLASFDFSGAPTDGSNIYLEVAAGVTTFILAGRNFEARSKRRAGAALRALLELGAKDVAVLRDGVEVRIPTAQLAVGDRFVVRPGEKIATDSVDDEGSSAVDASTLLTAGARERVGTLPQVDSQPLTPDRVRDNMAAPPLAVGRARRP